MTSSQEPWKTWIKKTFNSLNIETEIKPLERPVLQKYHELGYKPEEIPKGDCEIQEKFFKSLDFGFREDRDIEGRLQNKDRSDERIYFDSSRFFNSWLRDEGEAYHFIFRHDLDVTNIQFAELKSLITQYLYDSTGEVAVKNNKLHIISVRDFKYNIKKLVDTFPLSKDANSEKRKREIILTIVFNHFQTIKDYIVIDCFYGSCAVFIPFLYNLCLEKVCANSGYIHTCGKSIDIRNTKEAKYEKFRERLARHLREISLKEGEQKALFKVYSDQDKSKNHQDDQDSLDKLKIYVSKFYMGNITILEVLNELKEDKDFGDKLLVDTYDVLDPEKGNDIPALKDRNLSRAIFLFTDSTIDFSSNKKNRDKYYICYEQSYKNHNPLYKFEENKPAWIAPVTIPHTLIGAMINLAEIDNIKIANEQKILILDPFGGSGTTYLESLKYGDKVKVVSNDIAKISNLLCKDNITFFRGNAAKDVEELITFTNNLKELIKYLEKKDSDPNLGDQDFISKYKKIIESLCSIYSSGQEKDIQEKVFELFEKDKDFEDFYDRILFYIVYRSIYKHLILGNAKDTKLEKDNIRKSWIKVFIKYVKNYAALIESLIANKSKTDELAPDKNYLLFDDYYSKASTINYSAISESGDKEYIKVIDILKMEEETILKMKEEDKYDLIVTDPPYGFNTEENIENLFEIYTKGIKYLIISLKSPGQLVLSLPEHSYNGQHLFFFAQKDFLIQHIISTAQQYKKEIVNPASSLTYDRKLFLPPYYWESKRSLRRAILHFKIQDIKKNEGEN